MTTYQNTRTGRVVDIPEDPPTRQDMPGRQDQWDNYVRRIRDSKRWVRTDRPPTAADEPEAIPPAYLDPGDGTQPYPIPPAHSVAVDAQGRRGDAGPVHPGYQAGDLHDPAPPAYGVDDRVSPYLDEPRHNEARRARRVAEGNPEVDDVEAATRAPGMQYDVDGNRPDAAATPNRVPRRERAEPGAPDVNDLKVVWVDYAVEQGMDRVEAEDLTKKELVARFKG